MYIYDSCLTLSSKNVLIILSSLSSTGNPTVIGQQLHGADRLYSWHCHAHSSQSLERSGTRSVVARWFMSAEQISPSVCGRQSRVLRLSRLLRGRTRATFVVRVEFSIADWRRSRRRGDLVPVNSVSFILCSECSVNRVLFAKFCMQRYLGKFPTQAHFGPNCLRSFVATDFL